ncbi:MAG: MerC domain-containing protein [Pseudomonadota bacterium]
MADSQPRLASERLDTLAVAASTLCLVHCLVLPLLVPVLALIAPFAENELVHKALVLVAVPVSGWVIYTDAGRAGRRPFVATAVAGLALLICGAFIEPLEDYETPLTVAGSLLVASAHLWRLWHKRTPGQTAGADA